MKQMKITLETISPVIVTAQNNSVLMTATQDFFSGSILRGLLAKQYIAIKKLDKEAHKDPVFRQLFFKDLKFVDAYFAPEGKRSFPFPQSLQIDKQGNKILDLLTDTPKPGFKTLRGMGVICEEVLESVKPIKKMQLHMSRCHAGERISGKSSAKTDGNIYNYEALSAGQTFVGYIIGEEEALEILRETASESESSYSCHVGRSKFTQYGVCRLTIGNIEPLPQITSEDIFTDKQGKQKIFLRLETPFIPEQEAGMKVEEWLQQIAATLKERCHLEDLSIGTETIFASAQSLKNFVGVWGMKRPEETALAAGSVFALEKQSVWTEQELAQLNILMYEGVGRRTEEGFGQLRVWRNVKLKTPNKKPKDLATGDAAPETYELQTDEVKKVAARILHNYIMEQVRNCAAEDAGQFSKTGVTSLSELEFSTSIFGELELLLDESEKQEKKKDYFQAMLDEELENRSEMKKNLEKMKLYSANMYDWLVNSDSIPHPVGQKLSYRLNQDEELQKLLSVIEQGLANSDELYFEYWRWFFKHARKQTRIKKEARG